MMREQQMRLHLSFQMWTNQMQDTLTSKKKGDSAFRQKDFTTAIDCYSQFIEVGMMVSPTIYARRCLSYLMNGMAEQALSDVVQALVISPTWPTAFYLQAAALLSLAWRMKLKKRSRMVLAKRQAAAVDAEYEPISCPENAHNLRMKLNQLVSSGAKG